MTIPKRPPSDGHDITWAVLTAYLEEDLLTPHIAFDQIYLMQPGPPPLTTLTPRQELAARFAESGIQTGRVNQMTDLGREIWVQECFAMADAILADGKDS